MGSSIGPPLSPARSRASLHRTEPDNRDHGYAFPSLPVRPDHRLPSNNPHQTRPNSHHGRSVSHPFPSFLHTIRKRQEGKVTSAKNSAVDNSPVSNVPASKVARVVDGNLTIGKCMTCDSMVRWPKELIVFRCTVCMTINDLKSRVDSQTLKRSQDNGHSGKSLALICSRTLRYL
jgi:E3 ubiquitin-protein ligase HECTD2